MELIITAARNRLAQSIRWDGVVCTNRYVRRVGKYQDAVAKSIGNKQRSRIWIERDTICKLNLGRGVVYATQPQCSLQLAGRCNVIISIYEVCSCQPELRRGSCVDTPHVGDICCVGKWSR